LTKLGVPDFRNAFQDGIMAFLKLLFLRHAESEGNRQGRMLGWAEDDLTETGRSQATALAHRLQAEFEPPTHIYSSPLARAAQTADILVSQMATSEPIAVQYVEALKELQMGVFTGLTWAEAQIRYPDLCNRLEASLDWLPIPAAETLPESHDRAVQFTQHILTTHRNGDRLWIITHNGILQHLLAAVLGCDRTWRVPANHTALFEFWLDHQRWSSTGVNRWNSELWKIRHFNCDRHLQNIL
jgi:2,3-bisphosphoglycerate-dependent phosphoglycerate mutase